MKLLNLLVYPIATYQSKLVIKPINHINTISVLKFDLGGYLGRKITMTQNSMKNNMKCPYCSGTGYIKCRVCDYGCWRCQDTTLEICPFCGSSGKGKYAYNYVLQKK